jgi:hypothetical protein
MDTDFKSLEQRYGTSLAMKIWEEIAKAEQRQIYLVRANQTLKSMKRFADTEADDQSFLQNKVA